MSDETNKQDVQRVGQHEEMLDRLDKGFKSVLAALDSPGTSSQVVIQLDTAVQEQILGVLRQVLGIVKDIRKNQSAGGGLTPEEESALAAQLDASSGPLKAAVEANQPVVPPVTPAV
jgi:hypothetical protein